MLNVLRNKAQYGTITGTLSVNDKYDSIEPLCHVVGFVPQEDILHSELRVEEAIMFSSLLKNPFEVSTAVRRAMVEEIIEVLGLQKCRKSVIGDQEIRGVSGGQRKRVSIAVELVGNPSICFLDEPTSGLDSTTSIELIETLKGMTAAGMSIVTVIHQPRYEIFESIDVRTRTRTPPLPRTKQTANQPPPPSSPPPLSPRFASLCSPHAGLPSPWPKRKACLLGPKQGLP